MLEISQRWLLNFDCSTIYLRSMYYMVGELVKLTSVVSLRIGSLESRSLYPAIVFFYLHTKVYMSSQLRLLSAYFPLVNVLYTLRNM